MANIKCGKLKNSCKICLRPVTYKNGLKCCGACESWLHYACLNYTPGRIKDIKAGIIKVTCPCPDCQTNLPKEYRTDMPYVCDNIKCPAHFPPKCESKSCPSNASSENLGGYRTLSRCGKKCKKHVDITACPNSPVQLEENSGCSPGSVSGGDVGTINRSNSLPLDTLQQMCNTVGQLTNQLNALLQKMQPQGTGGPTAPCGGACRTNPQYKCPKSCACGKKADK